MARRRSQQATAVRPAAGESAAAGRRSGCPVACTLDVVGDRWTLLLIRDLLGGKRRYGEFLTSAEKIPTNVLADRLKRLEREGIVRRVPYSAHPPRDEYLLTPEGEDLGRAVDALASWGIKHFPGTARRVWPGPAAGAPAAPGSPPGTSRGAASS
jgi:DNA-binding HxlR family transcriptional regulator